MGEAQPIRVQLLDSDDSRWIDAFREKASWLQYQGYRPATEEPGDYYISQLDGQDKYTLGCQRCVSPIFAGIHRSRLREVSRIAHLSPSILNPRSGFRDQFHRGLLYFQNETELGTRVITLVGGCCAEGKNEDGTSYGDEYGNLFEAIRDQVDDALGLDVTVLDSPLESGETNLYYETVSRIAHILHTQRPVGRCMRNRSRSVF